VTETVPTPPIPLSPSGRRALAAAMLGTATLVPPYVCSLLVDSLDAAAWGLLAVAGATPAEARAVLGALWVVPE
jgi:hypothetical protein